MYKAKAQYYTMYMTQSISESTYNKNPYKKTKEVLGYRITFLLNLLR